MAAFRADAQWDEFRWEREIRRDERRISRYFRELPDCLDLPGEEEVIFRRLLNQGDPVPAASGGTSALRRRFAEMDDEEVSDEELRKRNGNDAVEQIDRLAVEWNALFARFDAPRNNRAGVAVICLFGKLLARTADVVDTPPEYPALKISLAKRSLADLNELCGALRVFAEMEKKTRPVIGAILETLQHVRERLLALLEETRRGRPDGERRP